MSKINQNEAALTFSMLDIDNKEEYEKIIEFGTKQFYIFRRSFPSLPGSEEFVNNIVMQALLKAVLTFNPDQGTAFNTHFYNKLRGEITIYIKKEESTQNYAQKLVSSGEIVVKYTEDGFESESVTESLEDQIVAEEEYYRKKSATLMAKSELPMKLQRVMYATLEYDKIRDAADVLDLSIPQLKMLRNHALSLILKKVLRSRHLTDEEKMEMKKEYKLI